jgi:hypothetical protein
LFSGNIKPLITSRKQPYLEPIRSLIAVLC